MISPFPPPGFVPGTSRVPGIQVYVPGDTVEKPPEVLDFTCPKCGATTAYSVAERKLVCEHCGYSETPPETRLGRGAEGFEFEVETVERAEKGWGEERKELACQHCGGVVSTPTDTIAFSCPFCGSNKVLFREPLQDVLRPRYLIPFKISPQDGWGAVQKWLGNSWMLPAALRAETLRTAESPEKLNPVYIPYWTFSAACNAAWKAQVAHEVVEHHTVNGQTVENRRIEWRNEEGKVQKAFSDLLVPGTTHLNMSVLGRIDAFNIADLILYEPRHLAGMRAQAYDLPLEEAWDAGRQVLRENMRQACLDRASSTQVRNFTMSLDFSDESWRYILVPVYTGVYRYQEKSYQILVNGQTGRIAGPRPVDWEKVWLVIAGILSPGLLLSIVGWLFSGNQPGAMTGTFGLILIVVALVIVFFLLRQAMELEHV